MKFLYSSLRQFYHLHFFRWVDKHIQAENQHQLSRHKLYILPSRRGLVFLALIVVLWLLGTNYQNNLILSLAFFLISAFIVAILQTHSNLSGVTIQLVGAEPAFAGQESEFIFSLSAAKPVQNMQLQWQNCPLQARVVNIEKNTPTSVAVPYISMQRGWLRPGRLQVSSYFPLGLMRCWSYLNWQASALIYPAPASLREPASSVLEGENRGEYPIKGGEDFSGLATYRPGDSLRHISWKNYACERGLHVKEFSQTLSQERWLDIQNIQGDSLEQRLSGLCYWALQYQRQDKYYGLRLNGLSIEPNKGEDHQRKVLEALALYGQAG